MKKTDDPVYWKSQLATLLRTAEESGCKISHSATAEKGNIRIYFENIIGEKSGVNLY